MPVQRDAQPSNGSEYVEFERVSKSFDGRTMVVRDLDLQIRKGEFLTLLGPSGSGKTTCLMMLAGFETPTSGAILIDGRPMHHVPPRRRGIGMVFQNYALFPHMTVGENLAFPLQVRGLDPERRRDRVRQALQLVRLDGLEHRRPRQLSGGQQQRVAIARALVFEPNLVLMDEPLGALDRRLREELQYEIRRIHRDLGVTVLYVTHDQQEAMVLSDRVAVFRAGRIEQIASPEALYEEPTRSFVARFIGENNRHHRPGRGGRRRDLRGRRRGRTRSGAADRAMRRRRYDDPVDPPRAGRPRTYRGPVHQRVRGPHRGHHLPGRPSPAAGDRLRPVGFHRQDPEHRGPRRGAGGRPDPHRLDTNRLSRAGPG